MKIEQMAFGCRDYATWKKATDILSEVTDAVTFTGWYRSLDNEIHAIEGKAHLGFDYAYGIEREYLFYGNTEQSFHGLIANKGDFFLSHFATHVPSIDLFLSEANEELHGKVVMDILTKTHTSEVLNKSGRKYRYLILDQRKINGYFFKLIQRIEKPAASLA